MAAAEGPRGGTVHSAAVRSHPERPWHSPPRPAPPTTAGPREASRGRPAGLVTRTLANVVDLAVGVGLLLGGYLVFVAVRFLAHPVSFRFPAPGLELVIVLGCLLQASYLALAWSVTGRTYGDQLIGLRVTDSRGRRTGWLVASVRAMLCVLVPVGLLWVAVSRHNRSLQDVLLRTSVVYDWSAR